jgi:hypothetical protein
MFYYSIRCHVPNWEDITVASEEEWSKKDFERLLSNAYLAALRRIGDKPDANHDVLLPRYALEYLAGYGFIPCESKLRVDEEGARYFISACWFNLERVNEFLDKYPGKWLVVGKDLYSHDFGSIKEMTVLAVETSYDRARGKFAELQPHAVDKETNFYDTSLLGRDELRLSIIRVPRKSDFYAPEELTAKTSSPV